MKKITEMLAESKLDKKIVNEEKEIKTAEEFKEYAKEVLKNAHGDDYDQEKAEATIKGILDKTNDMGEAIGMLTSGLGESVNEGDNKVFLQSYPDGSVSNSYVLVDKISKRSKIVAVHLDPKEKELHDPMFQTGTIFNALEYVSESSVEDTKESKSLSAHEIVENYLSDLNIEELDKLNEEQLNELSDILEKKGKITKLSEECDDQEEEEQEEKVEESVRGFMKFQDFVNENLNNQKV